ncbi:CLC4E protein, partial [Atractosteus spatula]|nr:CLC4E protein [Atractosteus spatula]
SSSFYCAVVLSVCKGPSYAFFQGDRMRWSMLRSREQDLKHHRQHALLVQLVAVCLGLSCMVLLTIIIVLSVHCEYDKIWGQRSPAMVISQFQATLQDYYTLTMAKETLESETQHLQMQENLLQRQKEDLEKEMDTCQLGKNDLQEKKQKLEDEIQKKVREFADALIELSKKCEIVDQYCPTANQPLQERVCQYCPQGWELFNSKCYYFSTDKLSWSDSGKGCKTQGANLLIIDSREEQEFFTRHPKRDYYWIGLSDSDKENYWTWVDNTVLTTGYWSTPKINSNRANNCAVININAKGLKNWVDVGCMAAHRRICETKALSFSM